MGPMDWFKEASGFDFKIFIKYSIEAKNESFFIPLLSPKANMNTFSYIIHIAICLCNSLKCWFKHPLP